MRSRRIVAPVEDGRGEQAKGGAYYGSRQPFSGDVGEEAVLTITPFAHLHCHSEYSMLDGASRIKDLISFARDQNMPGIALTDHGVMYGSVKFYQEAKRAGVKPIMGCEVYVTADRK